MAGSHSHELARLFDAFQRLELLHGKLYRMFAEAHAGTPWVAALWRKTANEEDGHAAQFRLAAANYSGLVVGVRVDLAEANRLGHELEARIRHVRSNPPNIVDALRLAIELEEGMGALHLDQLATFENPAHQRLFKAMMSADQGHVQALRDALLQFAPGARPGPSQSESAARLSHQSRGRS